MCLYGSYGVKEVSFQDRNMGQTIPNIRDHIQLSQSKSVLNTRRNYWRRKKKERDYRAGNWIYRASGILEAIFHLSEAFYGLDTTF